jgi:uncharacterized protein (TIGR03067 family)
VSPRPLLPGLAGDWQPIAASVSGQELDVASLRIALLRIERDTYDIIGHDAERIDRGLIEILVPAGGVPVALDLVGTEGPAAGRRLCTIIELEADRLCICYDLQSDERPQSSEPAEDQLLLSISYARVPRSS